MMPSYGESRLIKNNIIFICYLFYYTYIGLVIALLIVDHIVPGSNLEWSNLKRLLVLFKYYKLAQDTNGKKSISKIPF